MIWAQFESCLTAVSNKSARIAINCLLGRSLILNGLYLNHSSRFNNCSFSLTITEENAIQNS